MKKLFLILFFCALTFVLFAQPNARVLTDSDMPLPSEFNLHQNRAITSTTIPLEPQSGVVTLRKAAPTPISPDTPVITLPQPIPLMAPDEPRLLPMNTVSLEQYASSTLYETPFQNDYRIMNMQLNDFGVIMSRKAGLNYIYNPAVRGTVNGFFRNTDPIYMLHMAAKANGFKLVIRDGIFAEFQRTKKP